MATSRSAELLIPKVVPLETPRQFFRGQKSDLGALHYPTESGSAWCLVYPDYGQKSTTSDVANSTSSGSFS